MLSWLAFSFRPKIKGKKNARGVGRRRRRRRSRRRRWQHATRRCAAKRTRAEYAARPRPTEIKKKKKKEKSKKKKKYERKRGPSRRDSRKIPAVLMRPTDGSGFCIREREPRPLFSLSLFPLHSFPCTSSCPLCSLFGRVRSSPAVCALLSRERIFSFFIFFFFCFAHAEACAPRMRRRIKKKNKKALRIFCSVCVCVQCPRGYTLCISATRGREEPARQPSIRNESVMHRTLL